MPLAFSENRREPCQTQGKKRGALIIEAALKKPHRFYWFYSYKLKTTLAVAVIWSGSPPAKGPFPAVRAIPLFRA